MNLELSKGLRLTKFGATKTKLNFIIVSLSIARDRVEMTEANINAYLTVTSLGLLGYNTDEYKCLYPGIAMELPPIKLNTFDKEAEASLLCCLHFLLSRLDYEEFPYIIEECWPYLCKNTKADFKNAILGCLRKLQMQGTVNVFDKISPQFWGLRLNVKGPEVWLLLRTLSDCCVECAIKALSPPPVVNQSQHVPIFESPNLAGEASPAIDSNGHSNSSSNGESSKKPRRKSIVQLQSEEFHSISHAADAFRNGMSPDPTHMDRSSLLSYIAEIQHQVEEAIVTNIAKQNRQHAYMEELDSRLKSARSQLDSSQKRIHKSMKQGGLFALSDGGRKFRVSKLEKISASLRLIEHLSESTLLGASAMLVVEDKAMLAQCVQSHHDHFPLPEAVSPTGERDFEQKIAAGQLQLRAAAEGMNLGHALAELAAVIDTLNERCRTGL